MSDSMRSVYDVTPPQGLTLYMDEYIQCGRQRSASTAGRNLDGKGKNKGKGKGRTESEASRQKKGDCHQWAEKGFL